jgi:hypothetical protein
MGHRMWYTDFLCCVSVVVEPLVMVFGLETSSTCGLGFFPGKTPSLVCFCSLRNHTCVVLLLYTVPIPWTITCEMRRRSGVSSLASNPACSSHDKSNAWP